MQMCYPLLVALVPVNLLISLCSTQRQKLSVSFLSPEATQSRGLGYSKATYLVFKGMKGSSEVGLLGVGACLKSVYLGTLLRLRRKVHKDGRRWSRLLRSDGEQEVPEGGAGGEVIAFSLSKL